MKDKITLKHDGWLVVADGEKALFLRNEGDAEYPNLIVETAQERVEFKVPRVLRA